MSTAPAVTASARELVATIGEVRVGLRADDDRFLADYATLYPDAATSDETPTIRIRVVERRPRLFGPSRYEVHGDGIRLIERCRADEVLPYVEWCVIQRVIDTCTQYLLLHAATLSREGHGIVIAGTSGAGKSTLAAGLMTRGWAYGGDELAMIDPTTHALHAFPRAICVKAGSFDVIEHLGLSLTSNGTFVNQMKGRLGFVRPTTSTNEPVPIRWLVFVRHTPGGAPRLQPIPAARGAFTLLAHALNREQISANAATIATSIAADAGCYRLDAADIDETCDLIEHLTA
jgi:HprK-related kinase A